MHDVGSLVRRRRRRRRTDDSSKAPAARALPDLAAAGRPGDPVPRRASKTSDPAPGIYAIAPDGTGLRDDLSTTPPNNEFDYHGPDRRARWLAGHVYALVRRRTGCRRCVYRLDLRTRQGDACSRTRTATSQRGGAVFSPDGTLVAYARIYRTGRTSWSSPPRTGQATSGTHSAQGRVRRMRSDVRHRTSSRQTGPRLMVRLRRRRPSANDAAHAGGRLAGDRSSVGRQLQFIDIAAPGALTSLLLTRPAAPPGGPAVATPAAATIGPWPTV